MTTTCPKHLKLPAVARIRDVPREHDDAILRGLAERCAGGTWRDSGAAAGMHGPAINTACNHVRAHDLKHSGERRAVVMAGYW